MSAGRAPSTADGPLDGEGGSLHGARPPPRLLREPMPGVAAATGREAARRILADRYPEPAGSAPAPDGPRPVFDLARFQADAVRRAERMLAARGGVLIADSVGLGKTFVALALAERALRGGARVLVSTPAALRREWTTPLLRLARELGVRRTLGLGRTDAALETSRPAAADGPAESTEGACAGGASGRSTAFLAWLSHTRLSRGTHQPSRLGRPDLVMVDEAHAFRNPRTRRYRALAALCRGARVALVTATPVNNSVMDLYHLLRLFAGDGDFRDAGVPDLKEAFRAAAGSAMDSARAPSLLPVMRAVVIRRTRPFLREHYRGIRLPGAGDASPLRFPRRAPPVAIRYPLGSRAEESTDPLDTVEALTFAALRPAAYRRPEGARGHGRNGIGGPGEPEAGRHGSRREGQGSGQHDRSGAEGRRGGGGVAELMRLLLLKRLESSVAALRTSVLRQVHFHEAFLGALGRGRLLAPADHRALYGSDGDGDACQLVFDRLALRPLPRGTDAARFDADVRADVDRLRRLGAWLPTREGRGDAKLARLRSLLRDIGNEKIVVFTEYRDTARYLWRALRRRRAVALVDGDGARLGRRRCGRRHAIRRFAPRANGVSEPHPRERVDLLIATDVLAEGLNLHDAHRVVSYDLPWNPVRLIQRVGRVDRIGSRAAIVYSYHFLPERDLERFLRLVARLRSKLSAIGRTMGAGAAVLGTASGAPGSFGAFVDRLAAGDADALDDVERAEALPFELEERLHASYRSVRQCVTESAIRDAARRETASVHGDAARGTGASQAAGAGYDPVPATVIAAAPDAPRRVLVACTIRGRPHWLIADARDHVGDTGGTVDPGGRGDTGATADVGDVDDGTGTSGGNDVPNPLPALRRDETAAGEMLLRALDHTAFRGRPDAATVAAAAAAARRYAANQLALASTPDAVPAHSPEARAARALLGALAAVPGGPDAALCRRVDALLARLDRRHRAGVQAALRSVLKRAPDTATDPKDAVHEWLDGLTAALGPDDRAGPGPRAPDAGSAPGHRTFRLVGIIESRPARAARREPRENG